MTLSEIRRLPEFNNHDRICKQLFERIYQSSFPDKPVNGTYEFSLKMDLEGTTIIRLRGEIKADG